MPFSPLFWRGKKHMLLSLEELRALPDQESRKPCVYFLWLDQELMYIGSTPSPNRRMCQHWQNLRYGGRRFGDNGGNMRVIPFNRATFLETTQDRMRELESSYQDAYPTPYNWHGVAHALMPPEPQEASK